MTTILQGSAEKLSAGSWVYENQGVAADKGFSHVSRHWYPQTLSFEQGLAAIEDEKRQREDITFPAGNVEFVCSDGVTLKIAIDGREFEPTDHAARQLCTKFGVPITVWTYYGRDGRSEGDVDVLMKALRNGKSETEADKSMLWRTYSDGSLRAVLSDKYSVVDNSWYLNLLAKIIPGGRLSHWRGNADTIHGNILIPDTIRMESDSDYGGMLSISNCEIGRRVVAQTPSIFRAICMNGCIWGATDGVEMRKRHIGIDLDILAAKIQNNIQKQIPLLTGGIDILLESHKLLAEANIANIFAAIAKANNLSNGIAAEFAKQWHENSGEKTAFGVIDAVTRAGQKYDNDTWVRCDEIGGLLVNANEWQRLNSRAKSMTDKEVAKTFGVAV